MEKKVLDVCCGPKGMWFDKHDERALYLDRRNEIHHLKYHSGNYTEDISPDIIGDFTDIKQPDNSFPLVVFDPPHITQEKPTGRICIKYGHLTGDWKDMLKKGFSECFRVLKPDGVLIFKWNECRIPVKEILDLTDEKPLFGHKSGKTMQTHWVCFMKSEPRKASQS
jgi:SAM-dependent methyltransferase